MVPPDDAGVSDLSAERILREHRRSWIAFERIVLFSTLHVALTLVSLALAFPGEAKVPALLLWSGGNLALVIALGTRIVRDGT